MKIIRGLAAVVALVFTAQAANAEPVLQLYIEGATYDPVTETWVYVPTSGSDTFTLRLWTIGAVGSYGTIEDVKLAVAYPSSLSGLSVTLQGTTVGGTGSYTVNGVTVFDPSTPSSPTSGGEVTDGSTPLLSNGKPLPTHGIYGADTYWQEFHLGDFTLTDSNIGDFINDFPTTLNKLGQINAYDVTISGWDGVSPIHFDLYDSIAAGNHALSKFAPFSHDAEVIPEPASLLVWSALGIMGLAVGGRSRQRRQAGPAASV